MHSISRNPPRQPPNPILQVSKDRTFDLRIQRANQAWSIIRFLLTKFYARGQPLSEVEFTILIYIVEKMPRLGDKQWYDNNRFAWLTAKQYLKILLSFRSKAIPDWAIAQLNLLSTEVFLNPRAFLGLESNEKMWKELISTKNRQNNRIPIQPRRIGVGYRDKGTAKDASWNGLLHWTEYAGHADLNTAEADVLDHTRAVNANFLFALLNLVLYQSSVQTNKHL